MGTKKDVMDIGVVVKTAKKKPVKELTLEQLKRKIGRMTGDQARLLRSYHDMRMHAVALGIKNKELDGLYQSDHGNLARLNDMLTKNGQTHQKEIARLIALIGEAEDRTAQLNTAISTLRDDNKELDAKVKSIEYGPSGYKPMDCCLSPQEVMELKDRYERAIKGLQSENAGYKDEVGDCANQRVDLEIRIQGLTGHIIYLNRLLTKV